MFNLQSAPEGTLESLLISSVTAVPHALNRALGEYPPPRRVLEAKSCAALRDQATAVGGVQPLAAKALDLTPKQRHQAEPDALIERFGTYSQLAHFLKIALNVTLESIASPRQPIAAVTFQVVTWAEHERQLVRMLSLAVRSGGNHGSVLRLLVDLDLISQEASAAWPRVKRARRARVPGEGG